MGQGLAVTWDNPDITIEKDGKLVDSHALEPSTQYDIIARIWNSSNVAPVAGLPVRFSYLSFGIGAAAHPIGTASVNLGVKGSPSCPAFARHRWKTPEGPGHYCVQVEPDWFEDANPANNLGQHNIIVKPLNSPRASFQITVFNPTQRRRKVTLRADGYQLPALPQCGQGPRAGETVVKRIASLMNQHGYQGHHTPAGWDVGVEPAVLEIEPMSESSVTVVALAPDGYRGRQAINVNGFADDVLVGGVTLYAASAEKD
jgi:hypothetical protein